MGYVFTYEDLGRSYLEIMLTLNGFALDLFGKVLDRHYDHGPFPSANWENNKKVHAALGERSSTHK